MTDAATIARRLTSAQKRAALHGSHFAADSTVRVLYRKGLIEDFDTGGMIIRLDTDLGLAVRAELERMEAGDA